MIFTTKGMMNESMLEKSEITEPVPCGTCITTSYKLDGEIVRQDVNVIASNIPSINSEAGKVI
jgi:hypothetical protein